ncbi:hypothetical protein DFH27DRAFT_565964 [Peziza echinospora]|nr:hypothetical protein DFH27DRAFT_565964 [Peziza echinospora]
MFLIYLQIAIQLSAGVLSSSNSLPAFILVIGTRTSCLSIFIIEFEYYADTSHMQGWFKRCFYINVRSLRTQYCSLLRHVRHIVACSSVGGVSPLGNYFQTATSYLP